MCMNRNQQYSNNKNMPTQECMLIGISGDRYYESLKHNLMKAVSQFPFPTSIEEVNEVDQILQFDLNAIPAVLWNGEVILEENNRIPDTTEVYSRIQQFVNLPSLDIGSPYFS